MMNFRRGTEVPDDDILYANESKQATITTFNEQASLEGTPTLEVDLDETIQSLLLLKHSV